jgi:uncharacterized protein (DUF4415 family)
MKDATTGNVSEPSPGTDWEALRNRADEDIRTGILDDPEAHATDESFWSSAKVVLPQRKQAVTMRLDADVLEWFRRQSGYQTRINAILRAYMKAHSDRSDIG